MVDVEERALRALEQQVLAGARWRRTAARHIGHHGRQRSAPAPASRRALREIQRRRSSSSSARSCEVEHSPQLRGEALAVEQAAAGSPGAPPCPRRPGRCRGRWCRSCRRPSPPRARDRARRDTAGSADRLGERRRADDARTPARASSSISSTSASGDTTTPLPMKQVTPRAGCPRGSGAGRSSRPPITSVWPALCPPSGRPLPPPSGRATASAASSAIGFSQIALAPAWSASVATARSCRASCRRWRGERAVARPARRGSRWRGKPRRSRGRPSLARVRSRWRDRRRGSPTPSRS